MNEVLSNVEVLLKIIAISRTDCVEDWDEQTLRKSLKWANYFEQVYKKFQSKQRLLEQTEQKIQSCIKEHGLMVGLLGLHVQDLASIKRSLILNLMQNRKLPQPLCIEVMKEFKDENGEFSEALFAEAMEEVSRDEFEAWPLLAQLNSYENAYCNGDQKSNYDNSTDFKYHDGASTNEDFPSWNNPANRLRYFATGRALRMSVEQHLALGHNNSKTQQELRKKLFVSSGSIRGQIVTLCSMISKVKINGTEDKGPGEQYIHLLLEFLNAEMKQKWTENIVDFLKIPPSLLCVVCSTHKEFLPFYIKQLLESYMVLQKKKEEDDLHLLVRLAANENLDEAAVHLTMVEGHLKYLANHKQIPKKDVTSTLHMIRVELETTVKPTEIHSLVEWDKLCSKFNL